MDDGTVRQSRILGKLSKFAEWNVSFGSPQLLQLIVVEFGCEFISIVAGPLSEFEGDARFFCGSEEETVDAPAMAFKAVVESQVFTTAKEDYTAILFVGFDSEIKQFQCCGRISNFDTTVGYTWHATGKRRGRSVVGRDRGGLWRFDSGLLDIPAASNCLL